MDPYKQLVTEFLTEDFVENYEYHRFCVDSINQELKSLSVSFEYTYNEYCRELLDRFVIMVDKYFASTETANDFFESYDSIIKSTLELMRDCKMGDCSPMVQ